MLELFARQHLRIPKGRLYVEDGAPLSAGLRSCWVSDNDTEYGGKVLRNLVNPSEYMTRTNDNGTGEPLALDTSNQALPMDGFGNRTLPMSGSGLGSFGMAFRDANCPWQPFAAGGYEPVTIAFMGDHLQQFGRVVYSVSSANDSTGRPFVEFRTDGNSITGHILCSGTEVNIFAPLAHTAGRPFLGIFTSRSATDHEMAWRSFGNNPSIVSSTNTNSCGSAAAEATHESIGTRRRSASWDAGEFFSFTAAWCWGGRGMTREELFGFLLDPFQMIRAIRPGYVDGAGGGPPLGAGRRRFVSWF